MVLGIDTLMQCGDETPSLLPQGAVRCFHPSADGAHHTAKLAPFCDLNTVLTRTV